MSWGRLALDPTHSSRARGFLVKEPREAPPGHQPGPGWLVARTDILRHQLFEFPG